MYRKAYRKHLRDKLSKSDPKQFYRTLAQLCPLRSNSSNLDQGHLSSYATHFSSITADIDYPTNEDFSSVMKTTNDQFRFRQIAECEVEDALIVYYS